MKGTESTPTGAYVLSVRTCRAISRFGWRALLLAITTHLGSQASGGMLSGIVELSSVGRGTEGAVFRGRAPDDYSGYSVAPAGDVNGDGVDDLLIGAPYAHPSGSSAGEVYLIYGQTGFGALSGTIELSSVGQGTSGAVFMAAEAGDACGICVAPAGDVDGDGLADLLIGAPDADPYRVHDAGKAYLVYGRRGASALSGTINLSTVGRATRGAVFQGTEAYDACGASVSSAGDTDGDGLDDVLIAAPMGDKGYLVYGRSGPAALSGTIDVATIGQITAGVTFVGIDSCAQRYQTCVSSTRDLNGDGLDDLLIGASRADPEGRSNAGRTYLVYGQAAAGHLSGTIDVATVGHGTSGAVFAGVARGDVLGQATSSAGDVDGDGLDDLLIGAPGANPHGYGSVGATYLVYGRGDAAALSGTIDLGAVGDTIGGAILAGIDPADGCGWSVSSAGDVNGDGLDDLLIGARTADPAGRNDAGATYLIYGRGDADALSGHIDLAMLGTITAGAIFRGIDEKDGSGRSVSSAGDINGDGLADLLIGATGADPADMSIAGETYLVYGQRGPVPDPFPVLLSIADGDFNAAGTWDDGAAIPGAHYATVVGDHTVTLAGDGTAASLLIDAVGGQLAVGAGSTLTVVNGLHVAAGTMEVASTGRVDVGADATIGTRATYVCELGGAAAGHLTADGDVVLAERSTLTLEVPDHLGDLEAGQWGPQTFSILTARGSLNGTFTFQPEAGEYLGYGVFVDEGGVRYSGEGVEVDLLQAAPGDTNGDGVVDGDDIQAILAADTFPRNGAADWTTGDFTGDGLCDGDDIQAILATNLFATGPYATTLSTSTLTPEPTTALLLATALLPALLWRRTKRW